VCTDRPGLLADVADVLRLQQVRVHDARIATFGARAEDVFRISDRDDNALGDARRDALRDALQAGIEGES
jgi:[protein-PII] uridylyltransferase